MVTLDNILTEYFAEREDGGAYFDIKNSQDLYHFESFLIENEYQHYFDINKLNFLFESAGVLDELTLMPGDTTEYTELKVQQAFLNKLKVVKQKYLNDIPKETPQEKKAYEGAVEMLSVLDSIDNNSLIKRCPPGTSTHEKLQIKISGHWPIIYDGPEDKTMSLWELEGSDYVLFYLPIGKQLNTFFINPAKKTSGQISIVGLTEHLHECFFVIALSEMLHQGNSKVNNLASVTNNDSLRKVLNSAIKITPENRQKIMTLFEDVLKGVPEYSPEIMLRRDDAANCAAGAYEKFYELYGEKQPQFIIRVFATGMKTVADAIITITSEEKLSISLKYQAGQLGYVSTRETLQNLCGIVYGENTSLLEELYKRYPTDIDTLLRFYVGGLNSIYTKYDKKKFGSIAPFDPKTITYPIYSQNSNMEKFYSKLYGDLKNISHPAASSEIRNFIGKYTEYKKKFLTDNINRYINDNKNNKTANIPLFLAKSLASENATSYMYVSRGGKKVYMIPSYNAIATKEKSGQFKVVSTPKEDYSDFSSKIEVFIGNRSIIQFDINLRWVKGQWVGDFSQVGKNLNLDDDIDWGK